MSYQALYRSWRPEKFSEIVGQEAVVRTLRRQVETDHIAHAYLFCGTRGTGKTTAAKVFARAINCLNPDHGDPCGECEVCLALKKENCMDVMEIDAASNNSVDEIRDLREKIKYPPTLTRYKVYIIDEVHMLSTGAFNALLKTLEEPPKHAVFILATTEPQKLLATILSRCQRFDFHRITVDTIIARLRVVLTGIGREAEDDALHEIASAAEGAMRDALSLLDVCLSFTEGVVTAELARDVLGTTGRGFMFEFTDALLAFDAARALQLIDEAMRRGSNPQIFARDAATHLRTVLMAHVVGEGLSAICEITEEDAQRFCDQAARAGEDQLMRQMDLFMHCEGDMRTASLPRAMLELCAVRACHPEQEANATADERLERLEKLMAEGVRPAAKSAAKAAPAVPDKPKPAAPAQSAAPRAELTPPPEYLTAVELMKQKIPSAARMTEAIRYAGVSENVVTMEFERKAQMQMAVLERKIGLIDEALTEAFGQEMHARLILAGMNAAKPSATAKNIIEQSYDVFGRDKIELTD